MCNTTTYDESGIYELTCNTCKLSYVGQTTCNLKLQYQEHLRYIKNNNLQSTFALHILQNRHEHGTIDNTVTLLKPLNNTTMLTPYEQFFIKSTYQQGKIIMEQAPGEQNPLFQLIIDRAYTLNVDNSGSILPISTT